jgi:hypothetical protein
MPGSPQWSLSLRFPHHNPVHTSTPHMHYMPSPSHSSQFYHSHNIGWGVQIIKLFITWTELIRMHEVCSHEKISSFHGSQNNIFSLVARMWAGWSRFQFPAEASKFFHFQNIQISSGAHPASSSLGTGIIFPGIKCLGWEVEHSHPSGVEVKWKWSYTNIPLNVFMPWTGKPLPFYLYTFLFVSIILPLSPLFSGNCFTSFFHENPQCWFHSVAT